MNDRQIEIAAGRIMRCREDGARQAIASFGPTGEVTIVSLPPRYTTNIAFGGTDMQTAFITQAGAGALLRMRWPEPGLRLNFNG